MSPRDLAADYERKRAAIESILRPPVLAALEAADLAPDSQEGRHALALAGDAGQLVRTVEHSRDAALDRARVAVEIVRASIRETARGVRTVRG